MSVYTNGQFEMWVLLSPGIYTVAQRKTKVKSEEFIMVELSVCASVTVLILV